MEWHRIIDKRDIDILMKDYCGFHDSCLVSLNYSSGASVDNNGSMRCGTPHKNLICFSKVNVLIKYWS